MRYRTGAYRDEVPPAANFLIAVGSVGFLISACVCLYFSTLHHREKVVSIFEQSCSNWTNHYRSQFESANFSISTSHGGPEKAFKLFSSETEKFSHSTSQDPYDPELTIYQPLKYISADSIPNWAFPAPDYDEDKTEYEEVLVTLTADHILPTGEAARSAAAAPAPGAAVGRVVVRAAPTPAPEQKCPLQLHGVYHPKERKCLIYEKLHMICITVDFDASSSSWKLHTQEDGNFGCDPFNDYHAYQYAHVSVGKTPVDHHPIFPQENLTDVRVYVRHARDPYLAAERLAGPRLDFGLGARDWRAVAGVLFLVGGLCLLQPCLRAKEALGERRARRGAGPLWAQIDPRGDSYGDGGDGDEERGGAALVRGGGEQEEEPAQFDVLRRGGPRWEERRGWDPPPGGGVAAPSLVTLELPELPPGEVSGAELPSAEVSGEDNDDDRRRRTPTFSGGGGGGGGGAALRRRRPGEGGKRRKKGAAGAAGVAAVPRGRQSATPDPLNPLLSPVMEGDREDGTAQTPQYPPGGGGGGGRAESFSPGPGRGSGGGGGGGGPRGGEGSGGGAREGGRAAASAAADLRASFEAHVTPPPEPVGRMIAAAEARDEAQNRRAMASIINQVEEGAEIEMMPAAAVEEDANKKSGSTSTQQKTLDSPLQLPKGSFL